MSSTQRECPSKRLPWSLSSFTAAEFGDLHNLAKNGSAVSTRCDDAGYTPLHLAAQQGQSEATALLLELGCPVDGVASTSAGTVLNKVATPLHRAAFSGAVVTMRLLIEKNANLTAKDMSFGDARTPLHKAAAGGRYLAVQLLLDALNNQDFLRPTLLVQALCCKDKDGKTPLDVALEYDRLDPTSLIEAKGSVARWDEVAGGAADWSKCVRLLRQAERTTQYHNGGTTTTEELSKEYNDTSTTADSTTCNVISASTSKITNVNEKGNDDDTNKNEEEEDQNEDEGVSCSLCGKPSIALYLSSSRKLVCKSCK